MSNILLIVTNNGVGESKAVTGIGLARVTTGAILLLLIGRLSFGYRRTFTLLSPVLATAVLVIFHTTDDYLLIFYITILVLELSLNILSSQFLAYISNCGGTRVSIWITTFMLSGAAVGMLGLQHLASSNRLGFCVAMVVLGAFLPAIMERVIGQD